MGVGKGWHGDPEGHARAGRKGGKTVLAKRGEGYFSEIGKKGGSAILKKHGREYLAEIGRKGGSWSPNKPAE